MASVTTKKMNWFSKPSAWKTMEAQRERRRAMVADFQAQSQALAGGFSAATAIQLQGVSDQATRSVQAQMQAKAQELRKEFESRMAGLDKLA